MFWADKIAKEIIDSGEYKPYWLDDMFTPSGFAHIGSLRGPLVHDIMYRALQHANQTVKSTYVFNDFDTVDGLAPELRGKMDKYLGYPLRTAASPEPGYSSFAEYYTKDFQNVLRSLGVGAEFLYSWDMYHEGKFNEVIRIALDNSEKILDIYQRVSGSNKRQKGWLPLQVICEACGKLGTTRVHEWDGEKVKYTCEPHLVTWATGCGHSGIISPFDGAGKLPWKVDWPAHWKVLGVTIEGAGKDHSTAGGSRDIAKEICKEVFHIPNPYNMPMEFFLIGGKKMSSSKGLGLKARDLTSVLPPAVGRFLFARTDYKQAIEIDPVETMAIPDLFDEYDRCWQAYIDGSDEDLARAFELSQIAEIPPKSKIFLPRFRDVANYIQHPTVTLQQKFEEIKGEKLTQEELKVLKEREQYARVWIGQYAPEEFRMEMEETLPEAATNISDTQKEFLRKTAQLIEKDLMAEALQVELYNLSKSLQLNPKEAFAAIYLAFLGKEYGPRAAWFLLQYSKEKVLQRLHEAVEGVSAQKKSEQTFPSISRSDLFIIDPEIKEKFPSVTVAIAVIKGVSIKKHDPEVEKEVQTFLDSIKGITTEQLGQYPEIISYRKLYKETGIDWHSRRPSPEALLRRVALGKGLYSVNTCVDSYNIVVMKHRISIGAFDYDQMKFPTILRFAKAGEKIHLLGDEQPTEYKQGEVAYFDQEGGYNIDFNFRDSQRTKVTENTKNIWINIEGVYDITPEQVERSLQETIEIITKYCGGTVEVQGIVK